MRTIIETRPGNQLFLNEIRTLPKGIVLSSTSSSFLGIIVPKKKVEG
jgi:hypothetical protein